MDTDREAAKADTPETVSRFAIIAQEGLQVVIMLPMLHGGEPGGLAPGLPWGL